MIEFDNPAWRSPATGSTKDQILEQRETFRITVAYVNGVMLKRYAIADEERQLMKKLEEEQRKQ